MAIPFYLPSDEETIENYRSMDDLLVQLYTVLRQILIRGAPVQEPQNQHRHGRVPHPHPDAVDAVPPPAAASTLPDVVPRLPQPDVVSSSAPVASAHPVPPPRRHRRRRQPRRQERDAPEKEVEEETPPSKVTVRDNWTQVGEDLRQIADEFSSSQQDVDPKERLSLLSLLVPPPFRGSIWLAVIFLFGWGALRSR